MSRISPEPENVLPGREALFTIPANYVILRAKQEAQELQHTSVLPLHVFLALAFSIEENERALMTSSHYQDFRNMAEKIWGKGARRVDADEMDYDRSAKKVFVAAFDIADKDGHRKSNLRDIATVLMKDERVQAVLTVLGQDPSTLFREWDPAFAVDVDSRQ